MPILKTSSERWIQLAAQQKMKEIQFTAPTEKSFLFYHMYEQNELHCQMTETH